jgi:putative membrane protein
MMQRENLRDESRPVGFIFDPRYPATLLILFLIYAAGWAYHPIDVKDWMLENALTVLFLIFLVVTHRRFPLSNISYTCIFVFLCLHTIGSHYTYSLVPYDRWTQKVLGRTLNSIIGWRRNNYDRIVHFTFGLLMYYPIRELFLRIAGVKGFWGYYLPLDVTMSFSMVYELIEWAAAVSFGGDLGTAYVGDQGDPWDAQKDMALATLGAVVSMCVVAFINWKFDKNFGAELRDSLSVKDGVGRLGEERLREMLHRE